jgi:hypothetical protein
VVDDRVVSGRLKKIAFGFLFYQVFGQARGNGRSKRTFPENLCPVCSLNGALSLQIINKPA